MTLYEVKGTEGVPQEDVTYLAKKVLGEMSGVVNTVRIQDNFHNKQRDKCTSWGISAGS